MTDLLPAPITAPARATPPVDAPARHLAEAARALREASGAAHDPDDLARTVALVDAALDDLAASAELLAYASMEASRRRRMDARKALPRAVARSLSWRLHGLRSALVAARRISSDLTRVLDAAGGASGQR